jgi:hypothetical protein
MSKAVKLAPFQKLLTVMISGKPVSLEEMDTLLGKEIYMYRISTYMWHIKVNANGVIKAIKDGRKVTGYQLMNVKEVKEYMNRAGITNSGFKAGAVEKKPSISKLADLKATPVAKKTAVKQTVVETVGKQDVVSDEVTVTEITETVTQ